jgi:hypothetical protein
MLSSKPLYYWDSSVVIAWVMDEQRPNGEMNGVIEIAEKIHSNQAILITSDYLNVELLPASLTPEAHEKLDKFFQIVHL